MLKTACDVCHKLTNFFFFDAESNKLTCIDCTHDKFKQDDKIK